MSARGAGTADDLRARVIAGMQACLGAALNDVYLEALRTEGYDRSPSPAAEDTGARFRPVVAIEVEGLLTAPVLREGEPPPEYVAAKIEMERTRFPRTAMTEPAWDENGRWAATHWFSRLGVAWVLSLLARGIEVVWASSWLEYANEYFGEPMGIPRLRSAVVGEAGVGNFTADEKVEQSARQFDGRPLLLVTDELPTRGRRALEQARRPRDRALTQMQFTPLTSAVNPGDVLVMEDWLRLARSAGGHERLRWLRQRDLRWERERNAGTPVLAADEVAIELAAGLPLRVEAL